LESIERCRRKVIGPGEDVVTELEWEESERKSVEVETRRVEGSKAYRGLTSLRTDESDSGTVLDGEDSSLVLEKDNTFEIHLFLDGSSLGSSIVVGPLQKRKRRSVS